MARIARLDLILEIPEVTAGLLIEEAAERSLSAHVAHILIQRYEKLVRRCACGFFLFEGYEKDEHVCLGCGVSICVQCEVVDSRGWYLCKRCDSERRQDV